MRAKIFTLADIAPPALLEMTTEARKAQAARRRAAFEEAEAQRRKWRRMRGLASAPAQFRRYLELLEKARGL